MFDLIQEILRKVQENELDKDEAKSNLESMINFRNKTEDNLLLAFAIIELEK